MSRPLPRTVVPALAAAAVAVAFAAVPVGLAAQDAAAVDVPRSLPRYKLAGPRFGFTAFTGETADLRNQAGLEPLMTQFGWQFETRIASVSGGSQALMEWIVLVGGVEQSELNLSVAWLAGYRLANGLELGVGPNVSVNKDSDEPTTSMVFAGGATLPFGDIYVPINLAVAAAEGGPRITALIGWIIG